ncbi:MAG: gp58-like family protein, partial [Tannerella sp.]|nr:gp58-like family protein [Tannerella sp.]
MRAKENLGKAVICCIVLAFAVTVGFWGCSEDYSPQIKNLNDRVDSVKQTVANLRTELNASISQLQTLINTKVWVERVEP